MHNIPDFLRIPFEMQEHFAKGGMIKRADGSYSRRGLWDNIRANRGSGRKPTHEMLEQEAKIRAKKEYGGEVDQYGGGGYIVRRSNARKGKTHVVIGPDGTKKYFGDSKLGQHPNDPARKKAFYARHKHNLEHNPYFRAFARATWADGGEVPHFDNGGYYGSFVGEKDAKRMQGMFNPPASSMTPSFFAMGGLTKYQTKGFVDDAEGTSYMPETLNSGQGINSTSPTMTPGTSLTNYGSIGPVYDSSLNAQPAQSSTNTSGGGLGPANYNIMNTNSGTTPNPSLANDGLSGSKIASRNQEYEDRMIQEYGITRKDIDKRYAELSAQYTNSTPEDIYSALSKEFGDQAKQNKQNELLKSEQRRMKTIAGGMKGASQTIDSAFAGADLLSRMNPNSYQTAVLNKNRENANPMNTMDIVGNRKGIEYAAHGGYTGLKEGAELDLSTQQIHELEKQGYKFQIL